MNINHFFFFLLLNFIFVSNAGLKCENETIEHCTKCNSGEDTDTCSTCEDKYFPILSDYLCFPCNDSLLGQEGCIGKCNSTNYTYSRHIFCEEGGCKEGFFNENGRCYNCSQRMNGCKKCIYEKEVNSTYGSPKCLECETDYNLTDGRCRSCYSNGCSECHYEDNYEKVICDKCWDGFYMDLEGKCRECRNIYQYDEYGKSSGYCKACSINETDYESCYCYDGFTNFNNENCTRCPDNCKRCGYNNQTNTIDCLECYDGDSFNSDKECSNCGQGCADCTFDKKNNPVCTSCLNSYVLKKGSCESCPSGCSSCTLDKKNNPICESCYNGYILYESGCYACPSDCKKCEIDTTSKYKNETICLECSTYYALDENKQCMNCENLPDLGCYNCFYNEKTKKYGCLSCSNGNYAYINNTYECLSNSENDNLKNCARGIYDEKSKTYECIECRYGTKKYLDEKICKSMSDLRLSGSCQEIENIGNAKNPIYSCSKCNDNYVPIKMDSKGKKDCEYIGNLPFCLEGEVDKNGEKKCTKCREHATLNLSTGVCECDFEYFGRDNANCYKCDDEEYGNIGCLASKGCYFESRIYYDIHCNQCKEGYYNDNGRCISCSSRINNCEKCHLDKNNTLKCDTCMALYFLNASKSNDTYDACLLNDCKEYPEIAPGCIICNDKLKQYKKNNKCQTCKYGYFKTKNESCVYCRSEQYGGPSCYECGYEKDKNGNETDNIICKDCLTNKDRTSYSDLNKFNSILSSDGKCYNCKYDLSELCLICDFSEDKKDSKELKCLFCIKGYYLDSDGKCIKYSDKIEAIPNCQKNEFIINNYTHYFSELETEDINFSPNIYNMNETTYNDYNEAWRNLKSNIKANCTICKYDYYLDDKGECQIIKYEDCKISFMAYSPERMRSYDEEFRRISKCNDLCYEKNYPSIYLKYIDDYRAIDLEYDSYKNISVYRSNLIEVEELIYSYENLDNKTKKVIDNLLLCYKTENVKKFEGCSRVLYIPKTKTYHCLYCNRSYYMDNKTDTCKKIEEKVDNYTQNYTEPCQRENLGNKTHPLYSCRKCDYEYEALITFDTGIKKCISNYDKIRGCLEGNATTEYKNILYNCSVCDRYYLPFYSKYYQRNVCQYVFEEVIKKKNISLEIYEGQEYIESTKGNCPSNYFTPNGTFCYRCDNDIVGMPGCKGDCNFSLKREHEIICQSGCKEGYIETSKGVCEACDQANKGCYQCHYENNSDYRKNNSKRIFQCDNCLEGYFKDDEGLCEKCSNVVDRCESCENNGTDYICTGCSKNYVLNDFGYCEKCVESRTILNNKCISCDDTTEGGVDGCIYCQTNGEGKFECKQCSENYILMTNNNTCLKRDKNKDLYEFDSCLELKEENNKLVCSRCKPYYSLLTIGDEVKCSYTPTIYDENFNRHYYYNLYLKKSMFSELVRNDYNFRQNYFFPCKETNNLGTNENPLYTCNKCYDIFEDDDTNLDYYNDQFYLDLNEEQLLNPNKYYDDYDYRYNHRISPMKVNDSTINNSYCYKTQNYYKNCIEAEYIIKEGIEIFNCTKCIKTYELKKAQYIRERQFLANIKKYEKLTNNSDIYFCVYKPNSEEKCMVNYCQNCVSDQNNFCSKCISSDYKVNNIGSCVKKLEVKPQISWKDIYKFNMTGQKTINGRVIDAPTFIITGITCSQIYSGYAFIFNMTFNLKNESNNNLEKVKKVPAICIIEDEIEKNTTRVNSIEANCVVNQTIDEKYEVSNIEGGNLNKSITPEKISTYKIQTPATSVVVVIDKNDLKNISSNNYKFEFTINGKLAEKINLPKEKKNIEMEMNEIDEKTKCNFKSDNQQKVSFDCVLELKDNEEKKYITFKNNEIIIEGSQSVYIESLELINLINENGIEPEPSDIPSDEPSGNYSEKCVVPNCQNCVIDMNYFCSNCISSDYEVNVIGSCIRKLKVKPAVSWKKPYGLNMKGQKIINGRIYKGPTFRIIGITCSQIYKGYVFIFYITFRLKGLRSLQSTKEAPAICVIENDIQESTDSINSVESDCVVNETIPENYEISNIKGENLDEPITPSEISGTKPSIILPVAIFKIDSSNLKNISAINNKFDFSLKGELSPNSAKSGKLLNNVNLPAEKKNIKMKMNEIDEETICDFKSNGQQASFDCTLDPKNSEINDITFKDNEVTIEGTQSVYIDKLQTIHLVNGNNYQRYSFSKKKRSHKTVGIVLGIVGGVIALALIGVALIYVLKSNKANLANMNSNNSNVTNQNEGTYSASNVAQMIK